MKLHRGPLTFLPKGILHPPADAGRTSAPPVDLPHMLDGRPRLGNTAAQPPRRRIATLKLRLSRGQGAAVGQSAAAAPPPALGTTRKASRRADLALQGVTTVLLPLLVRGAVRQLGTLSPAEPIPLAPDLPHLTMPGSFPSGTPEAIPAEKVDKLAQLRHVPDRVRQRIENEAADVVFHAAWEAAREAVGAALDEVSSHLPSVHFPAPPAGQRPMMPGTLPGTEADIRALLQGPPVASGAPSSNEPRQRGPARWQQALSTRVTALSDRANAGAIRLIQQGALQALDRWTRDAPDTPTPMPGAFVEDAPQAAHRSAKPAAHPPATTSPADAPATQPEYIRKMPGTWEP